MDFTGTAEEGRLKTRLHLSRRKWTAETFVLLQRHVPLLISDIRILAATEQHKPSRNNHTDNNENPWILDILSELKRDVLDSYCNYTVDLALNQLCRHDFVHGVAFTGPSSDFAALMTDSVLGGSDSIAISGDGYCHLRLTKGTFECLGLPGQKSQFDPRQYCCRINLIEDSYRPEKKGYQRIMERLDVFSEGDDAKLPFIACALKSRCDKLKLFNESVKEYPITMHSKQIVTKYPLPEFASHLLLPVNMDAAHNSISQDIWESHAYDALEWFGLVEMEAMQSLSESKQNPYVSTYSPPMLAGRYADIYALECNAGLLTAQCVNRTLEKAVEMLKSNSQLEWLYIHAKGHMDSPVSIAGKERTRGPSSDNDISFLLLKLTEQRETSNQDAMQTDETEIAVITFRHVNEFDAAL